MNDTSPAIDEKMLELIRKKTPEERLRMGCSMYDFSKSLVTRSILESFPNLTQVEIRREIFLRFYGNDFDSAKSQKILEYLSQVSD